MSSSFRLELNRFLSNLDIDCSTLLDCGASQGDPLSKRVKSFNVKSYLVLDLPEPHENSPKPDIAWDMNEPIEFNYGYDKDLMDKKEMADIVTAFELTDYIFLPGNFMKNIAFLLKPGGTAIISWPSQYPLHQPVEDDALRYMPGGIMKLAAYAGLEVVEMVKRRPETDLFEQFYRAERMRAAKHQDHKFTGIIATFRKKM